MMSPTLCDTLPTWLDPKNIDEDSNINKSGEPLPLSLLPRREPQTLNISSSSMPLSGETAARFAGQELLPHVPVSAASTILKKKFQWLNGRRRVHKLRQCPNDSSPPANDSIMLSSSRAGYQRLKDDHEAAVMKARRTTTTATQNLRAKPTPDAQKSFPTKNLFSLAEKSFPDDSHPSSLPFCCCFRRFRNSATFLFSVTFSMRRRRLSFSLLLFIFMVLATNPNLKAAEALLVHHHSGGFRGVPGRFCADLPSFNGQKEQQCCSSRNDSCAVPIAGTMCYCDIFCDRRPGAHPAEHKDPTGLSYYDYGDCCPDFWCHCRGEQDQCLYGPQSPFATITPHATQTETTMFVLSAQSPATVAPPRRVRVSQDTQPLSPADDEYYFDHLMQQQQPSLSADHHNQQHSSQQNSDDAADSACCHHYHDDDVGDFHLSNPVVIPQGETVRINCNTCTCRLHRQNRSSNSGPRLPDVECTKHICLIEPHFIAHLNAHWISYGWQSATNYSYYWGKTLQWGLKHRLGTHAPTSDTMSMIPVRVHGAQVETIPENFDARERWRSRARNGVEQQDTLAEIVDQGNCGGSWAFSTVQVAQDRLNVIFNNRQRRNMYRTAASPSLLSIQQLLACDRKRNQLGCDGGGHVDRAWWYMRKKGVVSESCYPTRADWWWSVNDYNNDTSTSQQRMTPRCELDKPQQLGSQPIQCPVSFAAAQALPSSSPNMRYKMSPPYRIAPVEAEIQTEILRSGPVQAIIRVRPDFFMYRDGVYKHTEQLAQSLSAEKYHAYYHHRDLEEYYQHQPSLSAYNNRTMSSLAPPLPPPLPEPLEAHHAVRIIGWGVDYTSGRPLKYWECANTWGTWWGRDGYFRILRGAMPESESDVETFIIGVWPRRPVRVDKKPNSNNRNNDNENDNNNANDRQFRSRRQQQLSSRKRERRRLKKTLQQRRRLERYFNMHNNNNKRHKRLEKRKLMMGLKPTTAYNTYDYMEDDNNSQLARLKRLSRAVQNAMKHSDTI